jgi:hypothetical protein
MKNIQQILSFLVVLSCVVVTAARAQDEKNDTRLTERWRPEFEVRE